MSPSHIYIYIYTHTPHIHIYIYIFIYLSIYYSFNINKTLHLPCLCRTLGGTGCGFGGALGRAGCAFTGGCGCALGGGLGVGFASVATNTDGKLVPTRTKKRIRINQKVRDYIYIIYIIIYTYYVFIYLIDSTTKDWDLGQWPQR